MPERSLGVRRSFFGVGGRPSRNFLSRAVRSGLILMNQPQPSYTRDQLVAFLAAWMKTNPELTLSAARIEGMARGYTVGRREYEEARRIGTGSPIHPEHASTGTAASPSIPAEVGSPTPAATMSEPASATLKTAAASDERAWFVAFLKNRPSSSFADVNAAALASGVRPTTPIGFGLARKAAGIASVTKPKLQRSSAPEAVAEASLSEPETLAAPRRRSMSAPHAAAVRSGARGESNVFADVERLMADYERLREALLEISRIVRSAGAD